MGILVEICCGSADDVFAAKEAGADRVELNSAMFLGGLTPSIGELKVAKGAGLPVMTMVRPRGGGFCYTQREFETMLADAETLLDAGSDGIVFGILTPQGEVDVDRCRKMLEVAGDKPAVFHRAFDVVPNWRGAMEELISLGFTRILTSGQAPTVAEGVETLKEMVEYGGDRIEILPGAGFTVKNAKKLLRSMGAGQMHIALPKTCRDSSSMGNPAIYFGGALYPPESLYDMADKEQISQLIKEII